MESATALIDEASDLAADGKTDESVVKYRKALTELDRIEAANPERAASPEFATLRNKRAYVNAAIDSMLLGKVRDNAKAVAVSDTSELEKKLAEENARRKSNAGQDQTKKNSEMGKRTEKRTAKGTDMEKKTVARPQTWRGRVVKCISEGDYAVAKSMIEKKLEERPNNAMTLNLKAMLEEAQGKVEDAAKTLERAMLTNPRNHFAFYNMAGLVLRRNADDKVTARRYYETGRAVGGPADRELEDTLK